MDRVFEADGRPLLRQLLGGRAGPLLTGGAFSRLATREVRLDEVSWASLDATTRGVEAET